MKRILALALCLLALCPAALCETYVAESYGTDETLGYCMLIRDDGTPLTPPRTYSSIYRITPEGTPEADRLYAVTPLDLGIEYDPETAEDMIDGTGYTRMGLMDAEGKLLTGFDYESLDYDNGYVSFTLPGGSALSGGMDPAGNVVIEPVYASIKSMGNGRWLAMAMPEGASAIKRVDDGDGEYTEEIDFDVVCVEGDGNVRKLGLHTRDRWFNVNPEGICALWSVDEYGGQTVYIDSSGALMFDKSFRYGENFEGDYAVVAESELYGVIDKRGEYVIPPEYDYISTETGKPIIATRGSSFTVYDPASLEMIMTRDYEEGADVSANAITRDLLGVVADGVVGVYRITGELLFEVPGDSYLQLYGYNGGDICRLVQSSGDWPEEYYRLIDLEGNAVSGNYRMVDSGTWRDGHGRFVTGDYKYVMDSDGEPMVDWNTYRYGLIDENGETLLPMVYDELRPLAYDRFWAVAGGQSGLIDAEGKWYYTVSDYETLMD